MTLRMKGMRLNLRTNPKRSERRHMPSTALCQLTLSPTFPFFNFSDFKTTFFAPVSSRDNNVSIVTFKSKLMPFLFLVFLQDTKLKWQHFALREKHPPFPANPSSVERCHINLIVGGAAPAFFCSFSLSVCSIILWDREPGFHLGRREKNIFVWDCLRK